MAKIFCIANQKGGVGKTTTTVNLAAGLAKVGQRVLMVDLDPQGNATMGSGVDKRSLDLTVYDVLLESASVKEAAVLSDKCGYWVLGANRELAGAEVELVALEHREKRLKAALAEVGGDYDFVLIDCPPSLSMLTLNGLCSAHGVIVPMQCEYFALEGLTDLVNTIKQVHANLNTDLQIIGLLRVMFDPRITLQQQVSEQLKAHFGDKVFDTVIPRNVRLAEAPSHGKPINLYDRESRGAIAYLGLAGEMIRLRNESLELLKANLRDVENLFRTGSVPRFELLQAQVQMKSQEPLLLEAENNRAVMLDTFNFHLGGGAVRYAPDDSVLEIESFRMPSGDHGARKEVLVAAALRQGVPAVIAMQFAITDRAAIRLAGEFYRALADGEPVVLTVGDKPRLPAGPLLPSHRSLQTAVRAWVEEQTGLQLGFLEQLYKQVFGKTGCIHCLVMVLVVV